MQPAMFHTKGALEYGTQMVGGVTPGKGGTRSRSRWTTAARIASGIQYGGGSSEATGANASVIYVPPAFAADAIMEAVDAELDLVICITEGIPVLDMVKVKRYMEGKKTRLIGPNCPGVITPGECKIGIMPGYIHKPGHIGVVSRSGTLTYEAVHQLTTRGIGQSTAVGIGGDPVNGTEFHRRAETVQRRPGHLRGDHDRGNRRYGGRRSGRMDQGQHEEAGRRLYRRTNRPPGKRMGHAGAIISGGKGTAAEKIAKLEAAASGWRQRRPKSAKRWFKVLEEQGFLEKCTTAK